MANCSTKIECETGIQLLARLGTKACIENLDPILLPGLQKKMTVEICGKSGSGKTEILYHLIARCILPPSWKELSLEGIEAGVLFIDSDHHFNLLRLVGLIEKRIHHASTNSTKTVSNLSVGDVSQFVKERLKLLHLIRCTSSDQLLITLHSIDNLVALNAISIIFVDSISAFYWLDRMNSMDNLKKLEDYYSTLISTFKKLVEAYSLILVATKQILMKVNNDTEHLRESCSKVANSVAYDFMGKNWQKLVNYHLSLEKINDSRLLIHTRNDSWSHKVNCAITDQGIEFQSNLSIQK